MNDNQTDRHPMYPALSLMERNLPPLKFGREPYWRAPITAPSRDVYIPVWNWQSVHELPEDTTPLTLDANGMYLAAMGHAQIAHSHLEHLGGWENLPEPRKVPPGYFRIIVPYWAFSGTIVSPLGDSSRLEDETDVWVCAPTLVLLLELLEEGTITDVVVLDSWVAHVTADFRSWVSRLKSVRTELLDNMDRAQTDAAREALEDKYDAFKQGYSSALSMMLTGDKCKTRRPDWSHTIYALAAAAQWRKAWRYTSTGHPLIRMGATDEITIIASDLPEAMSRTKPPFKFDPTGRALGALKPKKPKTEAATAPQRAADVPMVEDLENIL